MAKALLMRRSATSSACFLDGVGGLEEERSEVHLDRRVGRSGVLDLLAHQVLRPFEGHLLVLCTPLRPEVDDV
ncbi:hypothetical protein O1L60_24015 [Streptomyces diastatochromogenes]|nr:hypothetical protein [Streptomyces diastatochromogenes]